ncbi:potassium transporter Kup [Cereibacter sphaeroides]|uniref:potassium transporter Kup n=1 Tax=Cereibacter sphaeroides TaxID=1063 RepID=UPI001F1AB6B1|nr:potassium transporter Kup [Cereibacter sphaeroides]MCE6957711.1 potassium transporter Kup [Cereibacter sphaeroides]MCE6967263.1 potassium transporter Kup [Cereibacter sphaeroides]MCE6971476.1 potassium transporter Kup [Cereibacter sphaeroides]
MTAEASSLPTLPAHRQAGLLAGALSAIGVVYGDIGTSPLYAFREALAATGARHGGITGPDVLGVLSMITWALIIVVTLKYVVIVMRADNDGEGGTFSLLALVQRAMGHRHKGVLLLGMIGAGLFYGDAAITPAISVLSAIEGLSLVTPAFTPFIVPIAIAIILVLFLVQSRGTAAVAGLFGPVMLVWFLVLLTGGAASLVRHPTVLVALNPFHALDFIVHNGTLGLIVLGAAFLAVTGAEALYADMGHFGKRPIRASWIFLVFPALLVNYYGQGALVLTDEGAAEHPFYLLYPDWAVLPLVVLAACATVIASQAVISGAYSLTQQGIQLRLMPRLRIRVTSEVTQGQIYMPEVNFWLMVGVVLLVLLFGSSSALASAYGISVTGDMVITTLLTMIVAHRHWRLPLWLAVGMMLPFLALDLVFFGSNMMKILAGGYVPLAIAAFLLLVMWTWQRGTAIAMAQERDSDVPLGSLVRQLESKSIARVPGTAVYLTSTPDITPVALMHTLKHFKAIHEQNVILTMHTADIPRVPLDERVTMEVVDERFRRVKMTFGYAEEPDVPQALLLCRKLGWKFDIMSTSFILSRRSFRLATRRKMPHWQSLLYFYLARNATSASDYFRIPASRVVELGTQVNV